MRKSKHIPMDFEEFDRLFSYDSETGEIRNKTDRGRGGGITRAGEIATSNHGDGYLRVQFSKDGCHTGYQAHRVAWLLHTGDDPGDKQIDHIDGDRTNCRMSNLRLVNNRENTMNQRKRNDNTSGITGVSWNKYHSKWVAYISDHGKQQSLGYFKDKFEAICCRKSAEKRLGYHENHGK